MRYRLFCLLFTLVLIHPVNAEVNTEQCKLNVGVVPQFEHRKLFSIWRPLLKEVQLRTSCMFIWKRFKSIGEFEKGLLAGTLDLAYGNSLHVIKANRRLNYKPIIYSGTKKLKGILVVHKSSPLKSIKELDGTKIAFPSPVAFAASLVVRAELKEKYGISFTPVYVGSHTDVYAQVARKSVLAGGGAKSTLNRQSERMKEELRVFHSTEPLPPHGIMIHPRVALKINKQIQSVLLNIAEIKPELFEAIPSCWRLIKHVNHAA